MATTLEFDDVPALQGRRLEFDDASAQLTTAPRFENVQEPTWIENQLAKLPSLPQGVVDVAAGASEMGGLLRNAPRLQNVATESGWRTLGRVLDPVAAAVGGKAFQAATAIPKVASMGRFAQNVIGGGAAGGAVGTLSGEPIQGAVAGAAFGGALRPLEVLGSKTFDMAMALKAGAEGQVVNYLNQVFPNNKGAVIEALNGLRGIVSGEVPTAGMAAVSSGKPITGLKALEEGARSRQPQSFAERDIANEAARANPLEELAYRGRQYFNPETGRMGQSEAEALRSQVTSPLYRAAGETRIPLTERISAILQGAEVTPAVSKGAASFQQAQTNARVAGRAIPEGEIRGTPTDTTPVVSGFTPEWALPPIGETSTFMPNFGSRSINELQRVKNELSKQIDALSGATDAAGKLKLSQLLESKKQLDDTMRQSGEYALASDVFRDFSAPQNQAVVSDVLLGALRSPSGAERQAAFLKAVKEAPGTIKKAGGPRFSDLRQVYDQDQMRNLIQPLEKSIQREADYARLSAPQSSLPRMQGVFDSMEGVTPPVFNMVVTSLRKAASLGGKVMDTKAQSVLDAAMLNPNDLSKLLQAVPPTERNATMNYLFERMKNPELRGAVMGNVANPVRE